MSTLVASNIVKSHGSTLVLDEVSLTVRPHDRVGVVGPNGIGKSTLLRILAGLDQPDAGLVASRPPDLTVGYLPQEVRSASGETLGAYLSRRSGADHDDWEVDAVLREVDLSVHPQRLLSSLSGGQVARAALASILLARHDVLLLDEPTNDLDFAGLELLERFVRGSDAGIVVVSHDRAFLDRTVDRVLELEEGSRRAREYAGGFAEYERLRGLGRERQRAAHEDYDERRRELEDALRRRQGQASAAGRGASRRLTKALSQRTRSVERRLETLERVDKPWEPWDLRLDLASGGRGGDIVARLEQAVVERGDFRLGPFDLELGVGERVAVTGANGTGKSTLLAALLGALPLTSGRRALGTGIVPGELDQERESFGAGSLLEGFGERSALSPEDARTLLAKFGLGADDVLRPAVSLSPGERTRAGLALVAARGVNLLVLDEPTNHLDLPAIDELERALAGYAGTLVVVSHDRRFLEAVAPTRVFLVPGTVKSL
jgi:ATPase subunit of ABC transporter with duplicated ATPase domains